MCRGKEKTSSESSSHLSETNCAKFQFPISQHETHELHIPIPTVKETLDLLGNEYPLEKELKPFFLFCSMIEKSIKEDKEITDKKWALNNVYKVGKEIWDGLDREYTDEYERLFSGSDLPGPQLLFYLALLNEIAQQIPIFNIDNAELTKVFANSWRNSGTEYTDEFIILADKLGLN
ncbi:4315_t:CDS:2 [Entrophospora sp. SA101]|nr:4315_t:CDS:2 [Entrophospora sp. SA101]